MMIIIQASMFKPLCCGDPACEKKLTFFIPGFLLVLFRVTRSRTRLILFGVSLSARKHLYLLFPDFFFCSYTCTQKLICMTFELITMTGCTFSFCLLCTVVKTVVVACTLIYIYTGIYYILFNLLLLQVCLLIAFFLALSVA